MKEDMIVVRYVDKFKFYSAEYLRMNIMTE